MFMRVVANDFEYGGMRVEVIEEAEVVSESLRRVGILTKYLCEVPGPDLVWFFENEVEECD